MVTCTISSLAAEHGFEEQDFASLALDFNVAIRSSVQPHLQHKASRIPGVAGRAVHSFVSRLSTADSLAPRVELASIDLVHVNVSPGSSKGTVAKASLWLDPAQGLQPGTWCSFCGLDALAANSSDAAAAETGLFSRNADVQPGSYVAWFGGDASSLAEGFSFGASRMAGGAWVEIPVALIDIRGD